jgi:predicted ABC-type ATPase
VSVFLYTSPLREKSGGNPCNLPKGENGGQFGKKDDPRCGNVTRTPTRDVEQEGADLQMARKMLDDIFARGGSTWDSHQRNGVWTPTRVALHHKILDHFLEGKAQGLDKPVVIFMAGLPGAGKSTAAKDLKYGDKVLINADEIKEMLPEYDGLNAAEVHEESSYLAKVLWQTAMDRRMNIVFDGTLMAYQSNRSRVEKIKAAGYRVEFRAVDVSVMTSLRRAEARFHRGMRDYRAGTSKKKGRYVPPAVIWAAAGAGTVSKPIRNVRTMRDLADAYVIMNGDDDPPSVVERSGRLTERNALPPSPRRARLRETPSLPAGMLPRPSVRLRMASGGQGSWSGPWPPV